jgi:hypothetical protein
MLALVHISPSQTINALRLCIRRKTRPTFFCLICRRGELGRSGSVTPVSTLSAQPSHTSLRFRFWRFTMFIATLPATLGGADSQVKLITVSGKEYVVPATVLQLVGFAS